MNDEEDFAALNSTSRTNCAEETHEIFIVIITLGVLLALTLLILLVLVSVLFCKRKPNCLSSTPKEASFEEIHISTIGKYYDIFKSPMRKFSISVLSDRKSSTASRKFSETSPMPEHAGFLKINQTHGFSNHLSPATSSYHQEEGSSNRGSEKESECESDCGKRDKQLAYSDFDEGLTSGDRREDQREKGMKGKSLENMCLLPSAANTNKSDNRNSLTYNTETLEVVKDTSNLRPHFKSEGWISSGPPLPLKIVPSLPPKQRINKSHHEILSIDDELKNSRRVLGKGGVGLIDPSAVSSSEYDDYDIPTSKLDEYEDYDEPVPFVHKM